MPVPLVRSIASAHLEPIANPQAADSSAPSSHHRIQRPVAARGGLGTLLGLATRPLPSGSIPMLLCGGIAFAVDRLVDEIELPVRRLDRRLGKIPGVSAASLDENGLPLLILDMEDLIQTAMGRTTTTAADRRSIARAATSSSWTTRIPFARWSGACWFAPATP